MKALILSTATGGGHNTAAHAVLEALTERGVECRFEDCVAFGGQKLSAAVSNVYVKFVQAAPDAFGRLYRFAKAISTPRSLFPICIVSYGKKQCFIKLIWLALVVSLPCCNLFSLTGTSLAHCCLVFSH